MNGKEGPEPPASELELDSLPSGVRSDQALCSQSLKEAMDIIYLIGSL